MNKYIDVDKAIKEIIAERDDGSLDGEYKDGFIDGMSIAAKILDDLSGADVVEVVRCKDCIYHTEDNVCANRRWDNWSNSDYESPYPEVLEMDYCSYGERKDG